jgi:predicted DNA-binding transcriptional regulator AlpA
MSESALRAHPDLAVPAMDTISLERLADAKELQTAAAKILTAAVQKELLSAKESGQMCGRSPASWWRDHAAGRVPAPVYLGGATRWRAKELRAWIEAGCPPRKQWEAMEKVRKAGR